MVRNRNAMKKVLFTSAMAALLGLLSCSPKYVEPVQGSQPGFALSFFRSVNSTVPSDQNIVVSPYSAGVALSMLAEGAEGQTRAEFDQVLNGSLFKAQDLGSNDTLTVESSNSIWISDNFSVRNRYVELLEKDFDAFITTQNFADPATVKAINNWCAEHTSGKITEILDKLSPSDVMVLVNALYFNAPWKARFNPDNTSEAVFHGNSGDKTIPMMFKRGTFNYAEYQGCQFVELPYAAGGYSMYVLLPPQGMSPDAIIPYIGEHMLDSALEMLSPKEIVLRMPKFRLETELVLNNTLMNMGLDSAFGPGADFGGMSASGSLVLDKVKQKCYIDVSEKGTEAAAVTSAQMRLTSVRVTKEMNINRPFIFMIASDGGKDILFAGKIINL